MIFLFATSLYLVFAGVVIWRRQVCSEGAYILLLGLAAVLFAAVFITHILQPEDPNSRHVTCLKSGGQLIHTTLELKNTSAQTYTQVVEDCKR